MLKSAHYLARAAYYRERAEACENGRDRDGFMDLVKRYERWAAREAEAETLNGATD